MGNLLFLVTRAVERAAGREVPEATVEVIETFPDVPLIQWSAEDWTHFSTYLTATADSLKRSDATADAARDEENSKPDLERVLSPTLNAKVDKILRYMKVYTITAPIRALLIKQLEDTKRSNEERPKLPKKKIAQVWSVFAFCFSLNDSRHCVAQHSRTFSYHILSRSMVPVGPIASMNKTVWSRTSSFERFSKRPKKTMRRLLPSRHWENFERPFRTSPLPLIDLMIGWIC